MEIILNDIERSIAKTLAKKRYAKNRDTNTVNKKIGNQSDEYTDLEGIASEIAFCKIFNIYPDFNLDDRPAADCFLSDGSSVDVKSTKYKNGKLLCVPWKKPNVDLFALMIGEFPKYKYVGTMTSQELIQDKRLIDLGYGKSYGANQEELDKVSI
jgi:hypothetical protein